MADKNVVMQIMIYLIVVAVSYLIGSISFSIIFTRIFEKKDIREMGSGNAGFTNVLRTVGYIPSIFTFVCDFAKGFLGVYIGTMIFINLTGSIEEFIKIQIASYLCGLFCVLGHMFPCYFGFKGGKAVLTSAGMLLYIDYKILLIELLIFLVVFLISRKVSLASICDAVSLPVVTFVVNFIIFPENWLYIILSTLFSLLIGTLVVAKHKSNIERLINGTEKRITIKKK